MPFTHDTTPTDGHGPLTLGDLAMRSDRAHADHMATYTAIQVIHEVRMALPDRDQEINDALSMVSRLIREYRAKTYQEWRAGYRVWVTAAGYEIPPDDTDRVTDVPDSGDETED